MLDYKTTSISTSDKASEGCSNQRTAWFTEQQPADITHNTAGRTHRTVRRGCQTQRPHPLVHLYRVQGWQGVSTVPPVWTAAICGGRLQKAQGPLECRRQPTLLSDLGAHDRHTLGSVCDFLQLSLLCTVHINQLDT